MCADPSSIAPPFAVGEAVEAARVSKTPPAFHQTPFYLRHGAELEDWLRTIHRSEPPSREEAPGGGGGSGSIRLVHWNIQQGRRLDRILEAIERHPRLRDADLWTLNEVDVGMARSGNLNIAAALGERLGLRWLFLANYLELTKGPGVDAHAPGENDLGLHGIALLSRWPFGEAASADLPECWNYFDFPEEKRYGCRRALWARIRHPAGDLTLATLHTEVRNRPACRDRQVAAALDRLPAGPCLLAGDFNTHTFHRGGLREQAAEFVRLARTPREEMGLQLLEPRGREPLLGRIERAGFHLEAWNDKTPTAKQVLSGVEELSRLPAWLGGPLRRRFDLESRVLRMRLDWIGVRGGFRLPAVSSPPWTLVEEGPEGSEASDHAPIGAEIPLP